jgi:hypothetical protein
METMRTHQPARRCLRMVALAVLMLGFSYLPNAIIRDVASLYL